MACDMPNFDEKIDNVDYKSLRLLGHGATISQFQDKVKLVNDEECEIKILRGPTIGDDNEVKDPKELIYKMGDNVTFFSFTMKEFETMVKKTGGTIKNISGDLRAANGWMQTIGLPTIQDSANQLMWHMSKNHTATADNFAVVAIHSFMSHLATRKVNTFQRGYSMQMVQVLQGHNYVLTKSELDNTIVLYYRGYNVLQLAQRYTWANGFVWAYSMPINVANALDAKDNNPENPVLTASAQGIHNGGNHALKESPTAIRDRVVEYYVSTNSPLLSSNLLPEENLGRPDHVQYVTTNNNVREGDQVEEQDNDEGNDEDNDEGNDGDNDDAIGGTKKRKVDN